MKLRNARAVQIGGQVMSPNIQRPYILSIFISFVLIASILIVLGFNAWNTRQQIFDQSNLALQNRAKILGVHIETSLKSYDQRLNFAHMLPHFNDVFQRNLSSIFFDALKPLTLGDYGLIEFRFYDALGALITTSNETSNNGQSIADEKFFIKHKFQYEDFVFEVPAVDQTQESPYISLSRAIYNVNDEFLGVLQVKAELSVLKALMAGDDLGGFDVAEVIYEDGKTLVSWPPVNLRINEEANNIGRALFDYNNLQSGERNPDNQTLFIRENLYSIYKIENYPIRIALSLSSTRILSLWFNEIRTMAVLTSIIIVSILVFIIFLFRQMRIDVQLAEIIWGTNVGTWVWNVQTGETVFNDRWAEIIGYSLDEISPASIDTWMRFLHPDDIIKSGELLEKNFSGELDFYECEVRMRHKCGEWVWILDRGKVVEWTDDGKPLRLSGTYTDITDRKIAEELFAKNATHFRLMFEQNASVMLLIEPVSGKIVDANTAAAEFYGYPLDQLKTMLINQINMLNPGEIEEQLYLAKQSKQSFLHIPQRLSSGEERIVEVLTSPMQTGRQNLVFAIMNDVTEFEESQAKIVLAASVFESSREGIMITEADGMIIDVNDAFTRITGYSKKEVIGNNPRILASGLQDAEFYESMWHSLKEKGHWYGEIWNRRRDGEVYAEMQTITTVNDPNKGSKRYVALFSDITSVKEHEKQLEHIAHFDALTGLPNRVLLADRLHQAMSQALRRKQQLAVAFIDLDGFKKINDHFGHEAGDQLLVALAKRMKDGLREGDTLSRIGGDEFVAVITDLGVVEDCLPMLNRLLALAAEPVIFSGKKLQVSASLGVTFYPQLEAIDADQLQRQADQAMYQAKQSGKNRYHIFDAELDRSVRGHHETLERIRHALLAEEFRLYYQPKVNMHSGKFVGAEALIRWQHPDQGLLLPAVFLPVVEDHELAVDIDEWVIKTAILQMEAWQQEGHDIPISVNIGARLLQKSVFVQWLQSILEKHPLVKPGNLRLEVLETSALEDIAQVSQVIEACAQMGVLFALDDFGTGYSSLTYLKRLAVAELKIDQTFVRDMLEDPDDLAILEGVIGLAEAFHRDVIAEGVETIEHGRMLLQLGCELAQGYGIARPMPVDQLPVWAASWKAPESWTNCNKIKHEDQPLLYAIVEHRAWIENLKRYFEGLQDTPPQMNYHQCRFGIMMEHVKQNGASLKTLLDPIDPLHQKVHRLATELCELKASGNSIGAQERLGELYDLRNELTDKIEDVLASRYRDFH
jgi:diguanylate cyclase (GGDEF)-like protein/PAS domain S-box-containing protein